MSQKFSLHKIAILGTPRSGKTTLMVRLSKGLVDPAIQSTRGLDFHLVNVIKDNIKLQIWDLAGQDHYLSSGLFDDMVHGASAFLFCYNAGDAASIQKIDKWLDVAKKHKRFDDTIKYLVGLKADLVDTGQQVALNKLVSKYLDDPSLNIKHMIISAHKDMNISELLGELAEDLQKLSKKERVN
ncbi:MAG: GTP-binding protein [Candidatus Heimdallarchaeota archaeon]|nr:GTP-binding protein [Candidatus Heimdallarchaeota archaeon]